MPSYPPWPPTPGSPSTHPSSYPPPPFIPPTAQNMVMPPDLQGMNITPHQMAVLLSHIQAGTIPFPPPLPPPPQSYTPAAPNTNVPVPPQFFPHNGAVPIVAGHTSNGTSSRMDIDREEGEVSDVSQSQHNSPPALSASKKRKLRASAKKSPLAQSTAAHSDPKAADVSVPSLVQKKETVLPFVAALHKEGFTFSEFVNEGFDEKLLHQVYQELRIPIPPAQPEEEAANYEPAAASSAVLAQPSASANASAPKPSEAAKAAVATKPAAPMSRQDYLARLQAAKTKKSDAAAAAAAAAAVVVPPKQPLEPVTSSAPSPVGNATPQVKIPNGRDVTVPSVPPKVPTSAPVSAPNKQSQTTELVRKKIEALKATQRRLANNGTSTPPTSAVPDLSQTGDQALKSVSVQPTPTPTPTVTQPQRGIPGLYMSVSAKSPLPEPHALPSASESASVSVASVAPSVASKSVTPQPGNVVSFSSNTTSRKRPVASDLNEAYSTTADHRPFKRPFGQSRQNSSDDVMIIVSDDEDSSDDDEAISKPTLREKSIRDLPPLRDFPQRPGFNRQQSAFTPPLSTPGVPIDAEELKRKEQEISSLNLKIQEYEKRKAALKVKAQLPQSQPQTPSEVAPVVGKPTPQVSTLATTAQTIPASLPVVQKLDSNLSPARRAELRASISTYQLQKSNSEARIQELQKELARHQRAIQESEENERKLREELESLDVNTDGMTHSDMEAKKQEIDNLRDVERVTSTSTLESDFSKDAGTQSVSDEQEPHSSQAEENLETSASQAPVTEVQNDSDELMSEEESDKSISATEHHKGESQKDQPQPSPFEPDTDSDEGSSMSESTGSEDDATLNTTSQLTTNCQPNQEQEVPDVSDDAESDSAMDEGSSMSESTDSEDDNSPEELVWLYCRNIAYTSTKDDIRPIFADFDVKNIHAPRVDNRSAGHCFVRLPKSQAETAKNKLHQTLLKGRKIIVQIARRPPSQQSLSPEPPQQQEPESSSSEDHSSDDEMDISESSSSDAEDVEADQSNIATPASNVPGNAETSVVTSPFKSSAESSDEEDADEDEDRMDLESQTSSESSSDAEISHSTISQPQSHNTNTQNVADDLATELQPDAEQEKEVSEAINSDAPGASDTSFVPYQSVLKKFKGYRFHPEFSNEVQGGYQSLTYSHQIDPHKQICRYEVASGVCNDSSCDYQHFRDMAVTDNDVIVQMATDFAKHGRDAEEVERFKAGLATVLQQLQEEGNTNTETMAARVAQYRRDFNHDPTDILGL